MKTGDAKPRVLASCATLERHKGLQDRRAAGQIPFAPGTNIERSKEMTARLLTALGFVLLVLPFTASSSQADEVPLSVNWVGTVSDTAIDTNGDGLFVDLIDAKASGSFGASLVNVLSEFYFGGFCDQEQKVLYLIILFSRPVTTFSNSDQLFSDLPDGWMCLNTDTGVFAGEAQGSFAGGTGRFADASGTFKVEFGGTNVTLPDGLPGFGAIRGTMKGTVHLH